jgi:hypothetical protein
MYVYVYVYVYVCMCMCVCVHACLDVGVYVYCVGISPVPLKRYERPLTPLLPGCHNGPCASSRPTRPA